MEKLFGLTVVEVTLIFAFIEACVAIFLHIFYRNKDKPKWLSARFTLVKRIGKAIHAKAFRR